MKRQFSACQTPRSMYLSIFNSFRVIRCLSQCVSRKIAIFTTFSFPLGTPLGQSRSMLYGWKENSMLTNCFAACTHLSSTVSQLFEPQVEKIAIFTYRSPHFPPGDAPATQYVDGWKDNSMLAKPLAACTYLFSIVSELYDA